MEPITKTNLVEVSVKPDLSRPEQDEAIKSILISACDFIEMYYPQSDKPRSDYFNKILRTIESIT